MPIGTTAAKTAHKTIEQYGQTVTVRRRIAEGADGTLTTKLKCMAQPLDEARFVPIRNEDGTNVLSALPMNFIFHNKAHVVENDNGVMVGDEILLDEIWYSIGNVTTQRIGDTVIMRECVGSRE